MRVVLAVVYDDFLLCAHDMFLTKRGEKNKGSKCVRSVLNSNSNTPVRTSLQFKKNNDWLSWKLYLLQFHWPDASCLSAICSLTYFYLTNYSCFFMFY